MGPNRPYRGRPLPHPERANGSRQQARPASQARAQDIRTPETMEKYRYQAIIACEHCGARGWVDVRLSFEWPQGWRPSHGLEKGSQESGTNERDETHAAPHIGNVETIEGGRSVWGGEVPREK